MSDILEQIVANKRLEIAAAKKAIPLTKVQAEAKAASAPRDFLKALTPTHSPRIIAECKSKSPSRGEMIKIYDPKTLALAYERGGAAAISVLTDRQFFGGDLAHMTAVRDAVQLPVLRKDFIVDEYQIFEARAHRASR